jgi:hypothetical protein
MGRMWSKLVACGAVRGKPSRINDAVVEVVEEDVVAGWAD